MDLQHPIAFFKINLRLAKFKLTLSFSSDINLSAGEKNKPPQISISH